MDTKILSLMLLICGTLPFVYSFPYYKESVKSWAFEPLRPKEPPKSISAECGSTVTEAYGRLEKTYKRGEVEDGSSCTWLLRAPANHVVNIIKVGFTFEDRTVVTKPAGSIDYSGSHIVLRDDKAQNDLLDLTVNDYQQSHGGAFERSTSSKEELVVKVIYHDNVDNAVQKIYIEYEFLNVDDMNRLLQEHKH